MKAKKENTVFAGRIFRVTVEQITPTFRFERVYQRNGICVFPITKQGRVRFIRTEDPGGKNRRVAPVCGMIQETDPSPLACAKRELAEELGLAGKRWKLLVAVKSAGGLLKTQYFFVVRDLAETRNVPRDPDGEARGTVDLTYTELERRVWRNKHPADISFALLKLIRQK